MQLQATDYAKVLSLPWNPDLFWPNTTAFQTAKLMLEKDLDNMYVNSSIIFETNRYVRSIVIKFVRGNYILRHLTSTTTTTTTTPFVNTTTTKPPRGKRGATQSPVLDSQRDYIFDAAKSRRADGKYFIGGRGAIFNEYTLSDYSTLAWVEHQFMEVGVVS
jgi:SEA domain